MLWKIWNWEAAGKSRPRRKTDLKLSFAKALLLIAIVYRPNARGIFS